MFLPVSSSSCEYVPYAARVARIATDVYQLISCGFTLGIICDSRLPSHFTPSPPSPPLRALSPSIKLHNDGLNCVCGRVIFIVVHYFQSNQINTEAKRVNDHCNTQQSCFLPRAAAARVGAAAGVSRAAVAAGRVADAAGALATGAAAAATLAGAA